MHTSWHSMGNLQTEGSKTRAQGMVYVQCWAQCGSFETQLRLRSATIAAICGETHKKTSRIMKLCPERASFATLFPCCASFNSLNNTLHIVEPDYLRLLVVVTVNSDEILDSSI